MMGCGPSNAFSGLGFTGFALLPVQNNVQTGKKTPLQR